MTTLGRTTVAEAEARLIRPAADRAPPWAKVAASAALPAALWLFLHPYLGLVWDTRVYIGRGLADLDPAGIGRDLMFAHDGQAGFSLFTLLVRALLPALGANGTAEALTGLGTTLWIVALMRLAGAVAGQAVRSQAVVNTASRHRLQILMLVACAVLPSFFGGLTAIRYGTGLATPRLFAEAGVLAALGLLVQRRRASAAALMAATALFHPIMALTGAGAAWIMLVLEDRRWLALAGVGAVAALAGTALHLPVFDRLTQVVDGPWLQILRDRNPYLFPSLWIDSDWGRIAVQAGTAVTTAGLLRGAARRLFVAAAVIGALGVGAAALFGDAWPSVLVVQAQPWRTLWLTGALGAAGLGLSVGLARGSSPARKTAVASLVLAWMTIDLPALAIAATAIALTLTAADARGGLRALDARLPRLVWAVALVCALRLCILEVGFWLHALVGLPAGMAVNVAETLEPRTPALVAGAVVLGVSALARGGSRMWAAPLATCALLAGTAVLWRTGWNIVQDPTAERARLAPLLASRPGGEVLWLDGAMEPYLLAGRASWVSELQGASVVFSRPQALAWNARMARAVSLGLARRTVLTPWKHDGRDIDPAIATPAALARLCADADAPAWVISALPDGVPTPPVPAMTWRPDRVGRMSRLTAGRIVWARVSRYTASPCRAPAPSLRPRLDVAEAGR